MPPAFPRGGLCPGRGQGPLIAEAVGKTGREVPQVQPGRGEEGCTEKTPQDLSSTSPPSGLVLGQTASFPSGNPTQYRDR